MIRRWSGSEARALRKALRMSLRVFAGKLGVSARTVSKWDAGGSSYFPSEISQALLDTMLEQADPEAKELFALELRMAGNSSGTALESGDPGVVLVPRLETGVVHRPDDFEVLLSLLEDAEASTAPNVVALCGPGGFGKTTLATEASHDPRVRERFRDILWVETGEQCTPARVVQLVSDLCVHMDGMPPALSDPEQAGHWLARVLGERRALLVIDNVWSAADLAPFLLGGPNCVRLVTTRNLRVCPSRTSVLRLGPMSPVEICELLTRAVSTLEQTEAARLAQLCGGWPLLASVVGSSIEQDLVAGASPGLAVSTAWQALRAGPQAFDVWDADQRANAIGHAITASLRSLEEHVTLGGRSDLHDRYLSLAVFPAATPIPLSVLSRWWQHTHGWSPGAVRQLCRVLADRCLVDAYLADHDAIVLHDVFRSYLRHLAADGWAGMHASLLDAYRPLAAGGWSSLPPEHEYLWRNLPYHLGHAELENELIELAADPRYLITKAARFGYRALAHDKAAIDAVGQPDPDGPGLETWIAARALTGSAYLLHGLTLPSDIAGTLLATTLRSEAAPGAVDELRRAMSEVGDGIDVEWATTPLLPAVEASATGHVGAVTAVAVAGDLAVSGGEDGIVRVWDLPARRQLRTCRGHTGWIYAVAVPTDRRTIASAGDDGLIRLWRADSAELAGVLFAHTRRVRSVAFGQGDLLVSGAEDGRVCVWDTSQLRLARALNTPGVPVWSVAVGGPPDAPDSLVAVGGEDEFLRLYDACSGELLDEQAAHRDWIKSVTFDSAILVSGSGDHTVRVWDTSQRRLAPIRGSAAQPARIRCVASTNQGELVVAGDESATLRAFTANGPAGQVSMPAGVDWVRAIALSENGTVVAGCEDGALRTWLQPPSGSIAVVAKGANTIWSLAFADGARAGIVGRADGLIDVRDTSSGETLRTLSAPPGRVWSLAAAGDVIAAACGDGSVGVWSVRSGDQVHQFTPAERTWAVALDPAGNRLAASAADGIVRVWDLPSGNLVWERVAHAGRVRSMAFQADGAALATGGGDGTLRLWDLRGGLLHELDDLGGWARTVSLEPAGKLVAAGLGSGDISVYGTTSHESVARLAGHTGRILMLGFTPDLEHLVTAAADGTVRLWSLPDQRQLAQVRVDASLHCAAFDSATGGVMTGSAAGATMLRINLNQIIEPAR
ncbi:NB-ARC domain-containing protein [Flindersiella endophytica]